MHSLWKWSRLNGEIGNLDFPQVENNFEDYVLNLSSGKYDTCYFMQKQSFWFTGQENCYVKTMKFEELNTTVKTFFETNGVTWSDTKVNESPGPDYKTAYTPKMIEIVKERFKDEFETFGYSADLW